MSLLHFPQTSASVFTQRRERLGKLLDGANGGDVALGSGWARPRNFAHNVFPFRADSHFLYLTGLQIEGAVLLRHEGEWSLWLTPADPEDALFHGPPTPLAEHEIRSGLRAQSLDDLRPCPGAAVLPPQDDETAAWLSALLGRDVLAQDGPHLTGADARLAEQMVELRLVHDDAALEQLRAACALSAQCHLVAMAKAPSCHHETEIRGAYVGALVERGLFPAYAPIVTSHGEVLHQPKSTQKLSPDALLLCDVGGETPEGWAGDITRTFPASGKFTTPQREVYELVLQVQQRAIAGAQPGVRFSELHLSAHLELAAGLVELGILRGDPAALVERGASAVFFPHGLGHLLGLDVHDMEDLGDRAGYPTGRPAEAHPKMRALRLDRVLAPDMVITIEPGFYQIPFLLRHAKEAPHLKDAIDFSQLSRFSAVSGIRIEDDIRIRSGTPEVLSEAAVKSVQAIEVQMGRS